MSTKKIDERPKPVLLKREVAELLDLTKVKDQYLEQTKSVRDRALAGEFIGESSYLSLLRTVASQFGVIWNWSMTREDIDRLLVDNPEVQNRIQVMCWDFLC